MYELYKYLLNKWASKIVSEMLISNIHLIGLNNMTCFSKYQNTETKCWTLKFISDHKSKPSNPVINCLTDFKFKNYCHDANISI